MVFPKPISPMPSASADDAAARNSKYVLDATIVLNNPIDGIK